MRAAGVMQWTVRLEATTSAGEAKTTELVAISHPVVVGTLAEVGLVLARAAAPRPLDHAGIDVERLRHLLWNGCHEKACEALGRIASGAKDAIVLNEPAIEEGQTTGRALHGAARLHRNQRGSADRRRPALPGRQADLDLTGRGHRQPTGRRPHEQAPADALVAPGAHRVLQVRAAVLDGCFGHPAIQFAA